jgi:hypothetical protein
VRIYAALFAVVLGCILVAGLWPFGSPPNEIASAPGQKGIRLGKHATLLSSGSLENGTAGECTVEIRVRPAFSRTSGTLLAFYDDSGTEGITLVQSLTDLRLDSYRHGKRLARVYVDNFFRAERLVLLSAVYGPNGTSVYSEGKLVREFPGFRSFAGVCTGRFVAGDGPGHNQTWQGDLLGLAIYNRQLSANQVWHDYIEWRWTKNVPQTSEKPAVLYVFTGISDQKIEDQSGSGIALNIPERYVVVNKTLLSFPVSAAILDDSYLAGFVDDVLLNIAGFIPFGFALRGLLSDRIGPRRASAFTLAAGFALSLAIETAQVFLPTRDSDITDVVTNTLGTWLGILLHRLWLRHPVVRCWLESASRPRKT